MEWITGLSDYHNRRYGRALQHNPDDDNLAQAHFQARCALSALEHAYHESMKPQNKKT